MDKKPPRCAALKQPFGAFFIEARGQEVIVPALWGQDTFIEKARGSEVLGQMWAFDDKKGRPCCLIPEATALFQERVTDLLGKKNEATYFYVARCYRYERPQAGRYREFTQLGFEILTRQPEIGLEMSQDLCVGFLDSLGLEYEIDIAAKRGLTYYLQGEGFEIRCPELGAQKQVVGGGAYREGAGFGIGLDRLYLALQAQGKLT
ncbi:ATP phosphoribosyltransferase regulatory subunit [Collimonas fungivorans]|uniref:ATP phosphoribosyltransferase regulatory subunit n=1 Tax=Collimonas fungivorans TaxID=158899 RepID=UPI001930B9B7|nr:ATP phosphoribosyltransferase regulatory subunit [Collimonas fungivorans]